MRFPCSDGEHSGDFALFSPMCYTVQLIHVIVNDHRTGGFVLNIVGLSLFNVSYSWTQK